MTLFFVYGVLDPFVSSVEGFGRSNLTWTSSSPGLVFLGEGPLILNRKYLRGSEEIVPMTNNVSALDPVWWHRFYPDGPQTSVKGRRGHRDPWFGCLAFERVLWDPDLAWTRNS